MLRFFWKPSRWMLFLSFGRNLLRSNVVILVSSIMKYLNNLHFSMYQQSNHIAILKRNKRFRISETKVLLCHSSFNKLTSCLCSFLCTWRKTNIRHKSCFMLFFFAFYCLADSLLTSLIYIYWPQMILWFNSNSFLYIFQKFK